MGALTVRELRKEERSAVRDLGRRCVIGPANPAGTCDRILGSRNHDRFCRRACSCALDGGPGLADAADVPLLGFGVDALATLLGSAFSAFIPGLGGSLYVRRSGSRHDEARAAVGKIMLAGVAASLAAFLGFSLWAELVAPSTATTLGRYVGLSFGITDTLLFFAPFDPLPAGHLWRWHRVVWLIALSCFLGIWLLVPLI